MLTDSIDVAFNRSESIELVPGYRFRYCSDTNVSTYLDCFSASQDEYLILLQHLGYSVLGTQCNLCRLILACYAEVSSAVNYQYFLSLSYPENQEEHQSSPKNDIAKAEVAIRGRVHPLSKTGTAIEQVFMPEQPPPPPGPPSQTWTPGPRPRPYSTDFSYEALKQLKIAVPAEPLVTRLSGRRFPPQVDVAVLRHWLSNCEDSHVEPYYMWRSSTGEPHNVEGMNLIDVDRRCVTRAPPRARYVALSYVWGPPSLQSFQALKSKFIRSEDQVWEMVLPPKLPNTIEDTIQVVQAMGERFLWIDSLCITQGDQEARETQIAYIYFIYNNAVMTIVAASGSIVDAGLPGWKDTPRSIQSVENVQGIELVTALPPVHVCIKHSPWFNRAWTLQERFFSRRLLVFTENQVYFQCATGNWCEDIRGRDTMDARRDLAFIKAQGKSHLRAPEEPLFPRSETSTLGPYQMSGMERLHIGYPAILSVYTTAKLTNSSDILRAVVGIARAMEPNWGTFVCGLPEKAFDEALLWTHESPLTRRRAFDTGSVIKGRFFPTWSWVGWHGGIRYVNHGADFSKARSRIIWYPSTDDKTSRYKRPSVSDAIFYSAWKHKQVLSKNIKTSPTVAMDPAVEFGLESGALRFWATCATLRIHRDTHTISDLASYSIIRRHGDSVGGVILDEVSNDCSLAVDPHHLAFHEFICLSQSKSEKYWISSQPCLEESEDEPNVNDYRDDDISESAWCDLFNVLVIRISHELPREFPPAYLRAGIGSIHGTAWKAKKPEWRLINLR
ncbi:hypothetical protein MMC17_007687 [Xylographa soralifera]|nr:hypothetical protein [Xylographa soralifera]